MNEKDDQKIAKKQAKARVKAMKKGKGDGEKVEVTNTLNHPSPPERSASAAERQVRLQRWRVAFALVSTLIALATLGVMLFRQ